MTSETRAIYLYIGMFKYTNNLIDEFPGKIRAEEKIYYLVSIP